METPDAEGPLAKAFALMWGLDEPGTRGPKRGLSLDQVIDAAIEVADAEGAGALSMSRVAKHLGFTTMSLYRYVDSKDTLLVLVSDRAIGLPPELPVGGEWRAGIEAWAWAVSESIRRHPWFLDLPLSTPPMGPCNMAWLDRGLAMFADTPVPEPIKLQLVLNVSLYMIGRMRVGSEMSDDDDNDEYPAMLSRVLDPQRFPALTRALNAQAFDEAFEEDIKEWDADLRFGLDRLLDGYETFIRSFDQRS
ncbi:TetR/AcrR family transcriptional regulator [Nocardia sp. NPDC049149]|uniref:TetR/AcrR family transcriptional regulator n=1 Tax=Nocardia sp. NPDC049149 TaxID=3364315 RepID=UPI0037119BA9